jgi:hypothetical protein
MEVLFTIQIKLNRPRNIDERTDYRLFQTKVVGIQLLYWIEVKTIVSAWSKTTPLCENQVLQLWERGGAMSIQFLRNGKDRVYSHHLGILFLLMLLFYSNDFGGKKY